MPVERSDHQSVLLSVCSIVKKGKELDGLIGVVECPQQGEEGTWDGLIGVVECVQPCGRGKGVGLKMGVEMLMSHTGYDGEESLK